MGVSSAWAHDWYPSDCCNKNDCYRVRCSELLETYTGWSYRDASNRIWNFLLDQKRDSQDPYCHVCHNNSRPLCIFFPKGGTS